MNIFTIINFFNCNIYKIVNTNAFKWFFCQFLTTLHQSFWDQCHCNVIVKIISSICNIYLFYFSHFILITFCLINIIIIFRNIFFIKIYVLIVNKISINSNVDCKKYWKQYNVQYARITSIFTFTDYFYFFINIFSTFIH